MEMLVETTTNQEAMAELRRLRASLVDLVGRYTWQPYARWVRCGSGDRRLCEKCAADPKVRPHGPYIDLRINPDGRVRTIYLGRAFSADSSKRLWLNMNDGTLPLTVLGLIVVNIHCSPTERADKSLVFKYLSMGASPPSPFVIDGREYGVMDVIEARGCV